MRWTKPVVDVGWPETWEAHGASGIWWTIERLPDGYRLWQLYDRARYDEGAKRGLFGTLAMAKERAEELEAEAYEVGYRADERRGHRQTEKKLARLIRDVAVDVRQQGLDTRDDPKLRKLYLDDARDLREVAKLLGAGKWREAWRKAEYQLDTAVREQIPVPVWDYWEMRDEEEEK